MNNWEEIEVKFTHFYQRRGLGTWNNLSASSSYSGVGNMIQRGLIGRSMNYHLRPKSLSPGIGLKLLYRSWVLLRYFLNLFAGSAFFHIKTRTFWRNWLYLNVILLSVVKNFNLELYLRSRTLIFDLSSLSIAFIF